MTTCGVVIVDRKLPVALALEMSPSAGVRRCMSVVVCHVAEFRRTRSRRRRAAPPASEEGESSPSASE
jgi:hypothetical protein